MARYQFGRHTIETSREDKPLFSDPSITKGDLIDYYEKIADTMRPHIKDRPLALKRFPDGINKQGFFQKNASDYFPDWIDTIKVKTKDGTNELVLGNKKATLVYLADQAVITFHQWLSRTDSLQRPNLMVFDLDPSKKAFADVRRTARLLAEFLDELGLEPFAQITGSKGIHVVVPLKADDDFDEVRSFAQSIARLLASRHDSLMTVEQRKDKRKGRIFLDVGRNAYGQTMVAPYSVRARKKAPVATPITLDELGDSRLKPDKYTIKNISRRLASVDDPWRGMMRSARSLRGPRRKFEKMEHREKSR